MISDFSGQWHLMIPPLRFFDQLQLHCRLTNVIVKHRKVSFCNRFLFFLEDTNCAYIPFSKFLYCHYLYLTPYIKTGYTNQHIFFSLAAINPPWCRGFLGFPSDRSCSDLWSPSEKIFEAPKNKAKPGFHRKHRHEFGGETCKHFFVLRWLGKMIQFDYFLFQMGWKHQCQLLYIGLYWLSVLIVAIGHVEWAWFLTRREFVRRWRWKMEYSISKIWRYTYIEVHVCPILSIYIYTCIFIFIYIGLNLEMVMYRHSYMGRMMDGFQIADSLQPLPRALRFAPRDLRRWKIGKLRSCSCWEIRQTNKLS